MNVWFQPPPSPPHIFLKSFYIWSLGMEKARVLSPLKAGLEK